MEKVNNVTYPKILDDELYDLFLSVKLRELRRLMDIPKSGPLNCQEVERFAKWLLSKRFFVGHYHERCYVEHVNSYRDVIHVNDTERDLVNDLLTVQRSVQQCFPPSTAWAGVTGRDLPGAPSGVSLYVKLKDLPFGHYLFQIRDVQFLEKEILLRLKHIRKSSPDCGFFSTPLSSAPKNAPGFSTEYIVDTLKNIQLRALIWSCLEPIFSLHNLKQAGKFCCILLISAIVCVYSFVIHFGDFCLKFMREISILIQVCTPIFLVIMEFFTKCVAGFFTLIVLIWREILRTFLSQTQHRPPAPQNFPYLQNNIDMDWSKKSSSYDLKQVKE